MNQEQRKNIFNKYGGKCAYSGKELTVWEVDHITPKKHWKWFVVNQEEKLNDEKNLVPCLKILNHYKRSLDLEGWRKYMLTFHTRLAKLPRNPKVKKSIKTKAYMMEVAEAFGITVDNPFNGNFYFESL